jgi:uncharacterized protein YbjT (DUF2867 family)
MSSKIAIIGSTGMIGKPVAIELVKAGFEVTALVRDEAKARSVLPHEIKCVTGDIANVTDVVALLSGQDYLYINLNLKPEEKKNDWHAETDGLKIILAAAKECKIKHVGFISSIVMRYQGMNNYHWWVFDVKQKAVELIKNSGIPYTIFYPSAFMENFYTNYRQGNKIMLAGEAKAKMYFISGSDYGKQVASAFKSQTAVNREYDVQGPEPFTAEEASREFVEHYKNEKLTISKAPLGLLKVFGLFSQKMDYVSHIIEALNNYPEKFTAESTWKDLGRPVITLKDFAAGKG